MNILIVGGAGDVGSILRPALEARYSCYYYDLRPVPGAESRSIVGDIDDDPRLRAAMAGMGAVINLTMGVRPGSHKDVSDIDATFNVNVRGGYRVLKAATRSGVRRFIYASSLSVYDKLLERPRPVHEGMPPDAWHTYGVSKRIGEFLCETAARHHPDLCVVALRLMQPMNEAQWPGNEYRPDQPWHPMGPNDTRRLFLAALAFDRPGFHAVQASGDLGGASFPNHGVRELLGWFPEGN